ncbi:MAG: hypothetical protein ACLS89_04480 [Collinsella sp.]
MPIIAALVGIVLGAIAAIAYMRTAKQGSLHRPTKRSSRLTHRLSP